ncbi:putative cAMP-dependent protein kinase catalytic subunit beta [Monocercomonoides exilis]|uniref:putative cAMP-dependent protein kinase catalytic subunit beta n=1 Tax=Monocercomonoides exilis TaxID=2049356 RepID=UPI003559F548|nr:putative cAMP-dependent protein kinase catalytic subunit beta [Monocercomonoides exilis]|eukprot:MONOS_8760.1-p1 / transcript=MONOS_8760.1 / gene=MONOS_8760 / organism=Monocercomonoides_exilis_PA203 / gene_product=serine / transcript_product=serine / location=Mono_scaffold00339:16520-23097(+) / protein_length=1698 / sequence_SO=supercontig / SO=protein_coding / is_pseudo=false
MQNGLFSYEQFRVEKHIGSGLIGEVHQVTHAVTEQKFAWKKIPLKIISTSSSIPQVIQELPNIKSNFLLKYHAAFRDVQHCYLVMDYCSRGSLRTQLQSHPTKFSDKETWVFFAHFILGLSELHDRGRIHGDLKPENIFIDKDGICKLSDYCQAQCLDSTRSADFSDPFVHRYAAPELIKDGLRIPAGDIFSLGVLLYEMATHTYPFPPFSSENPTFFIASSQNPSPLAVSGSLSVQSGAISGSSVEYILYEYDSEHLSFPEHFDPALKRIIQNMLKIRFKERPTAVELLEVPQLKKFVSAIKKKMSDSISLQPSLSRSSSVEFPSSFPPPLNSQLSSSSLLLLSAPKVLLDSSAGVLSHSSSAASFNSSSSSSVAVHPLSLTQTSSSLFSQSERANEIENSKESLLQSQKVAVINESSPAEELVAALKLCNPYDTADIRRMNCILDYIFKSVTKKQSDKNFSSSASYSSSSSSSSSSSFSSSSSSPSSSLSQSMTDCQKLQLLSELMFDFDVCPSSSIEKKKRTFVVHHIFATLARIVSTTYIPSEMLDVFYPKKTKSNSSSFNSSSSSSSSSSVSTHLIFTVVSTKLFLSEESINFVHCVLDILFSFISTPLFVIYLAEENVTNAFLPLLGYEPSSSSSSEIVILKMRILIFLLRITLFFLQKFSLTESYANKYANNLNTTKSSTTLSSIQSASSFSSLSERSNEYLESSLLSHESFETNRSSFVETSEGKANESFQTKNEVNNADKLRNLLEEDAFHFLNEGLLKALMGIVNQNVEQQNGECKEEEEEEEMEINKNFTIIHDLSTALLMNVCMLVYFLHKNTSYFKSTLSCYSASDEESNSSSFSFIDRLTKSWKEFLFKHSFLAFCSDSFKKHHSIDSDINICLCYALSYLFMKESDDKKEQLISECQLKEQEDKEKDSIIKAFDAINAEDEEKSQKENHNEESENVGLPFMNEEMAEYLKDALSFKKTSGCCFEGCGEQSEKDVFVEFCQLDPLKKKRCSSYCNQKSSANAQTDSLDSTLSSLHSFSSSCLSLNAAPQTNCETFCLNEVVTSTSMKILDKAANYRNHYLLTVIKELLQNGNDCKQFLGMEIGDVINSFWLPNESAESRSSEESYCYTGKEILSTALKNLGVLTIFSIPEHLELLQEKQMILRCKHLFDYWNINIEKENTKDKVDHESLTYCNSSCQTVESLSETNHKPYPSNGAIETICFAVLVLMSHKRQSVDQMQWEKFCSSTVVSLIESILAFVNNRVSTSFSTSISAIEQHSQKSCIIIPSCLSFSVMRLFGYLSSDDKLRLISQGLLEDLMKISNFVLKINDSNEERLKDKEKFEECPEFNMENEKEDKKKDVCSDDKMNQASHFNQCNSDFSGGESKICSENRNENIPLNDYCCFQIKCYLSVVAHSLFASVSSSFFGSKDDKEINSTAKLQDQSQMEQKAGEITDKPIAGVDSTSSPSPLETSTAALSSPHLSYSSNPTLADFLFGLFQVAIISHEVLLAASASFSLSVLFRDSAVPSSFEAFVHFLIDWTMKVSDDWMIMEKKKVLEENASLNKNSNNGTANDLWKWSNSSFPFCSRDCFLRAQEDEKDSLNDMFCGLLSIALLNEQPANRIYFQKDDFTACLRRIIQLLVPLTSSSSSIAISSPSYSSNNRNFMFQRVSQLSLCILLDLSNENLTYEMSIPLKNEIPTATRSLS